MNDPLTNATPRMTATVDRTSLLLWARRLRQATRSTSDLATGGVESLHAVEHALGGRLLHRVHDATVGEEEHPVGERRRVGVVGDHDDGLAEVGDGATQEAEHLGAGAGVEVSGR